MQKIILSCLCIFLFTSCFLTLHDDQELQGEKLYEINIIQNGSVFTAEVTVDQARLNDLENQLALEGKVYQPPEELFFWMSPTIDSGYGCYYPEDDYFYSDDDYYDYPTLYPVARLKINPGESTYSIDIDLQEIVDNGVYWLDFNNLDWYGYEKMTGFYLFASDDVLLYEYPSPIDVEGTYFQFDDHAPAGQGHSDLRYFPDSTRGETFIEF